MRILLIGAGGQVGSDLLPRLASLGELVATTRSGELQASRCEALDVADPDAVRATITELQPDVVVNATAYTAVDRAESEPDLADAVNRLAPQAMARACTEVGARFVHFSTDYVFDGNATEPYVEDDPVGPTGVYGATKAAGEQAVREACPGALILRTAWVYSMHGHNFLRTMLRLAGERDELRVVADQIGCPTPSWLIADVAAELVARSRPAAGIFHLVTRGRTSWHGFAAAIVDEACRHGLITATPRVTAITTAEYPTPARRPPWSVLDPSRLEAMLGRELSDWRSALAETFSRSIQDRG